MQRPRPVSVAIVASLVALMVAAPAAYASSDLNGDGHDDLVVGVPSEDISQVSEAGSVNVLFGSNEGITPRRDLQLDQADFGGSVEAVDRTGNAIAYGDFDNDGFDDVAIGVPTEDWNGARDAGVVHVIYGSSRGPRTGNTQLLAQAGKMAGASESGDFFGAVLAAGDFDDDGFDDLVIGIPGENLRGRISAGAIVVAYGSSSGITTAGSQQLSQRGKVPGQSEDFDTFGVALAVGDFNNDDHDDIVVGTPGEGVGSADNAGNVTVLFGRNSGVGKGDAMSFSQNGAVPGDSEAGDEFGYAVAAGDFDNDGFDDFAVGVRGEDTGAGEDVGGLIIFSGSAAGPSHENTRLIESGGAIPGGTEVGERFGAVLAAGDFDNDKFDDLVIGSPDRMVGANDAAGRVVIIQGSGAGLDTADSQSITQDSLPGGSPQANDQLGSSLRVGKFNNDGRDDLVVSSPSEDVNGKADVGVIHIIYGSPGSVDIGTAKRFYQGTSGVKGAAEVGDRFGEGL